MSSRFIDYIEELRNENAETLEKYENIYGRIEGDFQHQIWYTDYAIAFENCLTSCVVNDDANVTPEDYDFLKILIMASFSSNYRYLLDKKSNEVKMEITVSSNNQKVVKYLDDLFTFQINRLFTIYIKEQMELQIHYEEGTVDDKIQITNFRSEKIDNAKEAIKNINFVSELEDNLGFNDFEKIIPIFKN